MGRRTPLYGLHQALGARLVDFGGWDMPLHYGSQLEEHHAVRRKAGVFDVSHMCCIDLEGREARALLERLLANDVGKLEAPGRALYSCMCNESGGILDDLIAYRLDATRLRLVVNAGTRDSDLAWIGRHAAATGVPVRERTDLALLAVQGPEAASHLGRVLGREARAALALAPFNAVEVGPLYLARTGYTGEDGFEIMVPATEVLELWRQLTADGVVPCGLGARDTLRLEAGMNLYGSDMDASTNPFESGLAWTVAFAPAGREFIGRAALEAVCAQGAARKLVGLLLEERGVLRAHQRLSTAAGAGEVTSGTFSPTLERSIGLARVPAGAGGEVKVEIRGRELLARIVRPPFVRHGRVLIH